MSLSIVRGTNDKPASTNALIELISKNSDLNGQLIIGFPIINSSDGRRPIDAFLVSPDKGIIIFDLIEGMEMGDYGFRQDDAANKLEARLQTNPELMNGRILMVPVNTISYIPGQGELRPIGRNDHLLANSDTLIQELDRLNWDGPDINIFNAAVSAIQSITTIRKNRRTRLVVKENSRGSKLKKLENTIATLDSMQSKAVIETVNGVQRIRGLAGSGKTVVLALKAAYLHANNPDWRIAVTFNTRSLKGQFKRLINTFFFEHTGEEPEWDNLRILNAWGAAGKLERDGIYHEFCSTNNIPYYDFQTAKNQFGAGGEFSGVCEQALNSVQVSKAIYNAILVDEAQDFPPSFLRLCYELLDDSKRLVYAYDELQNLAGESLPSPEEMFGKNPDGSPKVNFENAKTEEPRRDILLEKCYRNSRPVLVTAHSLGFGIYRKPNAAGEIGLVQMFDNPHLWEEIGYRITAGELREGVDVSLSRTGESSPAYLEEHSAQTDLVQFIQLNNEREQTDWLVNAIRENISADELRHEDIVVINPDPLTTREKVGLARRRLMEYNINSHLAGVDTDPDVFFKSEDDSITFTGIFRAKGNEAGMVYIINAQDCHSLYHNLARNRNRLFTAITRSKAWVRVLGYGEGMTRLLEEYEILRQNNYQLHFTYPTADQRKHLKIVHRDLNAAESSRVKKREQNLSDLVSDLEAGNVHVEDLSEALIAKLETFLKKN